jgi:iron complex transport system ATP-binding protein
VTPVLELADVTFRRAGKQIIDGVSVTVQAGEHWALLGPNGAGKSTLLGFCAAVMFPTSEPFASSASRWAGWIWRGCVIRSGT